MPSVEKLNAPPPPVILQRGRTGPWLQLLIVALAMVWLLFQLPMLPYLLELLALNAGGWVVAIAVGLGFAALCGAAVRSSLRRVRADDPAIVIDASGITDRREEPPLTIGWPDIQTVKVNYGFREGPDLAIRLRTTSPDSAAKLAVRTLRRAIVGADVSINLYGVRYNAAHLTGALAEHQDYWERIAAAKQELPRASK